MEDKVLKKKMYSHIVQWETTGLSKSAYSKQLGISPKKFTYWQKKYEKDQKDSTQEEPDAFVPITLSSERSIVSSTSNLSLQITYPNGVKLNCTIEDTHRLRSLLTLMD